MFKILGIIFLVFLFFLLLIVMMCASAILSFIRKFREMSNRQNHDTDRDDRDYTGRRQQQYSYRYSSDVGSHDTGQGSARSSAMQDETVVDTRSPQRYGKKIFGDDEGEYVDFVEE